MFLSNSGTQLADARRAVIATMDLMIANKRRLNGYGAVSAYEAGVRQAL
jgi:hypothetical protein